MKTIVLKKCIPVLTLLLSTYTYSQRNLFSADSIPKALTRRNEIGITVSPSMAFTNPAWGIQKRFEITYKRMLNEKSVFRSSIGTAYSGYRSYSSWKSNKLAENGSSAQNLSTTYIKIGYERRLVQKKFEFLYGVDAIIAYYRGRYSTAPILKYPNDSLLSSLNSIATGEVTTETGFMIGLSPFIGARYNFTNAFSVSGQMGYNFTYQLGERITTNGNTISKTRFGQRNLPGFFSDISFLYKF